MQLDKALYSVPTRHVGKRVWVRGDSKLVRRQGVQARFWQHDRVWALWKIPFGACGTGTVIRKATREHYCSRADDFGSLEGETETVRSFSRLDDGWSVRVETRTRLRSDARQLRLTAQLDAYYDDTRVFSPHWDERIDRDRL